MDVSSFISSVSYQDDMDQKLCTTFFPQRVAHCRVVHAEMDESVMNGLLRGEYSDK